MQAFDSITETLSSDGVWRFVYADKISILGFKTSFTLNVTMTGWVKLFLR